MYGYPVRSSPFTNRETYTSLIRVADDDTGDFVNMAGVIGSGTFNSWNVRAGATLTTSSTTITIPVFPFGGNLSALALTVPPALVINQNDPIVIADLSGVNQMLGYVISYNVVSGALVAQIGCTFQWEVTRSGPPRTDWNDGYTPFASAGVGVYNGCTPLLTATLANGKILYVEPSVIQVQVPEIEMRRLGLGTYQAALTVNDSQVTRQVYVEDLPILIGGVTQ